MEFKEIHNPDASSIPPEWHGWTTHMHDEPGPSVQSFINEQIKGSHLVAGDSSDSAQIYGDHVGLNSTGFKMDGQLNLTGVRSRGYKIGGVGMLPGDPDKFHVHAGHALNKKSKGRFTALKAVHVGDPNSDGSDLPKPIRSLDEP